MCAMFKNEYFFFLFFSTTSIYCRFLLASNAFKVHICQTKVIHTLYYEYGEER